MDGAPLPVVVDPGGEGSPISVHAGTLEFQPGGMLQFRAWGPLVGDDAGLIASVALNGPYRRLGADSIDAGPLAGRVWSDTVEVQTAEGTIPGSHWWLLLRTKEPVQALAR